MSKQGRLAGFLGLEPYKAQGTDTEGSTVADSTVADSTVADSTVADAARRSDEHPDRGTPQVAQARADETRGEENRADETRGEETRAASAQGAPEPAAAHPYTPETMNGAETPRADRRGNEPRSEPAGETADYWEDAPVPNTEYTEQYAEAYANDGYYEQGYEPEETNGYTYGYEEEEDELRRITTIHPRSYNDAKIIGEAFRENIPVIMNVEEMPDADAKRLVDFASGLAFALEGRIERVTSKVFLLTPSNLEVLGVATSEHAAAFDTEGEFPFDQG